MAIATSIIIAASVAAAASVAGGIASSQFESQALNEEALQLTLQRSAETTQRAGQRVDEANQKLQLTREADTLYREQIVAGAANGYTGGSLDAISAGDRALYGYEYGLTSLASNQKEYAFNARKTQLNNQISSTQRAAQRASGLGLLNAFTGGVSSAISVGAGANQFYNRKGT